MTNPSPRPALRKAADAGVHPAAPRPARSPRARQDVVAPVPDAPPSTDAEPVAEPTPAAVVVPVPVPAPVPLKPPKKRHVDPARPGKPAKRKFSGATSDHLRVPELAEAGPSAPRSPLDALFDGGTARATAEPRAKKPKAPHPAPARPTGPEPVRAADLMSGKLVDLGAHVPKALRKATRDEAKQRGLDVDAVVTDLLHTWLTGRA